MSVRLCLMPLLTTLCLVATVPAALATDVPKADEKGLTDPAGFKRFKGSLLVYREDAAYDEVKLPTSKPVEDNDTVTSPQILLRTGARTALQYLVPEARSPLEVLRNYQEAYKPDGYETVYECEGEACGASNINLHAYGLGKLLMSGSYANKIGDNSAAACSGGAFIGDLRYAVLDNKTTGASMALMTWKPGDTSVYCDQENFKKQTSVYLVLVTPKAREQKMETLSASELGKSLDANGKVAVYGILFDTNKADIKPASKPSLDQIAALLKQQPELKLHVVGHTDNVGALPANLDLSKRRADAVSATLAKDYGIARDRLTANGVASLAPVASNADDAGKQKNRRVELVLQ